MNDILQRVGTFSVDDQLLYDEPQAVQAILKDMIVVEATRHFSPQSTEYVALSEEFEKIPDTEEAKEYNIFLKKLEDGSFERIKVEKLDQDEAPFSDIIIDHSEFINQN